jgi:GST-like protein
MKLQLLGTKGSGSLIVEAALIIAKVPYTFVETNYEVPADLERLLKINPTGQIPTMILPDGQLLTESAAMINYIHLISPETKLIPTELNQNMRYWRWICFIIGSVYPTFNYGDEPAKWTDQKSAEHLRQSTDEWRKKLMLQMEQEAGDGYFLNEFSGIDIYLAVMTSWRPRVKWFKDHCPKITKIVETVYQKPELARVMSDLKERFGSDFN